MLEGNTFSKTKPDNGGVWISACNGIAIQVNSTVEQLGALLDGNLTDAIQGSPDIVINVARGPKPKESPGWKVAWSDKYSRWCARRRRHRHDAAARCHRRRHDAAAAAAAAATAAATADTPP